MIDLKSKVERLKARHRRSEEKVRDETAHLERAREEVRTVERAQIVVQEVAAAVQQQAHRSLASVVTRCLEAVFDDPYEFRVDFVKRRGRTEAVLSFGRNGTTVDPMTASGGGVVDVAAFALRLACLMLSRPRKRRLMVLDEPFRFVSRDLRPRVKKLLETLAEEMGVQFVVVTHDPVLTVGKMVELSE